MRQVPYYLLIGNGRVASHFQHYFSLLNLSVTSWHRHQSVESLHQSLTKATHILLLISDNAIDDFIRQYLLESPALKIHCSGSLVSQFAYSAHPLMTFNNGLYSLEHYQNIPFILDHDAPQGEVLLPGLMNRFVRLDKNLKAKYHALCVLSGNFSCMLWQKLFSAFEQDFNLPEEIAHPYLTQVTNNLLADYKSALTGPLVRNDVAVMEDNLRALNQDVFQDVYKSFVSCYQKINAGV